MDGANKLRVGPVLSALDHIHEQGMSLNAWLEKKIAEMGADEWVAMLDSAFPRIPGASYLRDEDMTVPGSKNLRVCGSLASMWTRAALASWSRRTRSPSCS